MRTTKRAGIVAAGVAGVAAVVAAGVVLWPSSDDHSADDTTNTTVEAVADTEPATTATSIDAPIESTLPTTEASAAVAAVPEGASLVASFASDIPRFDAPDGAEDGVVAATWHDRPSVLPVVEQRPGWPQVRLPERPNGSTAWVRRADVVLATTPYRVEIDVATTRLRVFKDGVEVLDAPAGLGTDDAPTTVGNFFVAFVQEPPNTTSGWGPFVIVTSSHSETISDFQSSGDAIAAIHGPLGADDKIGDTGAYVSHGCIRLHLDDLAVLRALPVGTPIDVIDSSADDASGEKPNPYEDKAGV